MKTTLKILSFIITATILFTGLTSAANAENGEAEEETTAIECEKDADCPDATPYCVDDKCRSPMYLITKREAAPGDDPAGIFAGLPEVTIEQAVATAIRTILGAAMLLTIVAIVVAALFYLKSQGRDEDLTKAKTIIVYLLIGLAIMAAAYGIVTGITEFDFFEGRD